MTEEKQVYGVEAVPRREEVVEPEIVFPGNGSAHDGGPGRGEPRGRVFVKVYRPGPFSGLLALLGGLLLVAAIVSFGFIALLAGAVIGLVWLLLSPLLRLFRRG